MRPSRPLLPLAAAMLVAGLVGCTAPPEGNPVPSTTASARSVPSGAVAPKVLPSPTPVASDPVEIGAGDAVAVASGRRVGRLTFTDRGGAGTDIRLTGFGDVPEDLALVLLDEFDPKPGCLPDVFDTSSWQPDLVREPSGDHVGHRARRGDTMGNPAEFPYAMAMIREPVLPDSDVEGRAREIERFEAEVAAGCSFPTVLEAEITWRAR
jgi:hypothetical protein